MSAEVEKAAAWMYRGVWKILSDGFRVPEHPPNLPVAEGESLQSFHPSRRYLGYLKLWFWIVLIVVDIVILIAWIAAMLANPAIGLLLAVPALIVAVVPDIVAYVAIHLKYDTMWYVMSERSLRCRRGILTILEHTITFENVQNVHVMQDPVQQLFGISTIVIETAGATEGEGENEFAVGNKAIMQGIENPDEIRAGIMDRVRASKGTGLGDVRSPQPATGSRWTQEHVAVLREILLEAKRL